MRNDISVSSAETRIGPYKLLHEWGEGAFSRVYLAETPDDERRVLLKIARTWDAHVEVAFRQEYLFGSQLSHPHLGEVLDHGRTEAQRPYVVLAFYAGETLDKQAGPLGASEVAKLGLQLARGLWAIHRASLIHRDVSPANVMVEPGGNVRLLDFGMLGFAGPQPTGAGGTPLYMAPEALDGGSVDARTDLYSLGAVLYRLACGQAPFEDLPAEAQLAAILSQAPEAIAEKAPHLPSGLASLIMRLLAKEPANRPASAREVASALSAFVDPVELPLAEPRFVPGAAWARWEALAGESGVYSFTGASGLGRTRHLREAHAHLRRGDLPAIAVSAADAEGPYALAERLWRWAAAHAPVGADGLDATQRAIVASLWPWAFPESEPQRAAASLPRLIAQGLGALLGQVATGGRLAVLIDDWEAADAASRALLSQAWGDALAPFHWLLGSSEPVAGAERLPLAPFEPDAVESWLSDVLQAEPPEGLATQLFQASDGNPGWMSQALRHLQQSGQLAGWSAEKPLAVPATVDLMLDAQWNRLSLEQRTLAEVLALYAAPFAVADLAPLAALLPANWPLELPNLVARGFLALKSGTYGFSPGWWGSWIREHMPASRRARVAEKLAAILEASGPADAHQLHRLASLQALGANTEARIRYGLEAGRAMAALYANDQALAHLAMGLSAIESTPEAWRYKAQRQAGRELMGDVQRLTGALSAAEAAYEACLADASGPDRARLLVSLAKTRQTLNRFEEARAALEEALGLLVGAANAHERLRALTTLGRILHHLGDRPGSEARYEEALALAREADEREFLAESLSFLGTLRAGRVEEAAEGLSFLEEALALREAAGDQKGRNDTHMLLGNALYGLGRYRLALTHFEANRALSRAIGHRQEEAFACLNLALTETALGAWQGAARAAIEAHALGTAVDDPFVLGFAGYVSALAQLHLGDVAASEAAAAAAREREAALKSPYLRLYGLLFEAERHLFLGSFEAARRAAELAVGLIEGGTGPECAARARLVLAEAWLHQNQLAHAEKHLQEAKAAIEATGALGTGVNYARLEGLLAFRRNQLERARKAWESALVIAREQGLLQREIELLLALHLLARQDVTHEVSTADLARAYALAETQHTPDALALACLGLAVQHLQDENDLLAERLSRRGHELLAQFTQALTSPGARANFLGHPLRAPFCEIKGLEEAHRLIQQTRRLEMLLALGHTIGTTREPDRVLELVHQFTLEVTQAERCLILLNPGKGELRLYGDREASYSRTIVGKVQASRESVCVLDTQRDELIKTQASIMDLQVRSVMCVPMVVGQTFHGVLYVDSQVALGAFTPEDLRIVTAIAGQAAVALDNARLHAALQGTIQKQEEYIRRLEASENVIKHLEELDRVRGEYFQAASHDLRAPLASINVSCQAMLKGLIGELDAEQRETIEGIHQGSRSLMNLIDGILDAAKLEAGKLLLSPQPVALVKPVSEAVRLLKGLADSKRLALLYDEPAFAALPKVAGDERRLQRVVLNLLSNAIKFTLSGEILLSACEAEGGVEVAVADTGPGLPAERLANLFERYGAAGESGAVASSGLGLWLVKGLVDLHGGRIRAENRPEGGARFTVWLPRAR